MPDTYYQSVHPGKQIDDAISRIASGEFDKLADDAVSAGASAQNASVSAQQAKINAESAARRAEAARDAVEVDETKLSQAVASAAESEAKAKLYADQTEASVSGVASFHGRGGHVMPQSGDYTAQMVGAVPTSRKVNGKALSSDISLTPADVGAVGVYSRDEVGFSPNFDDPGFNGLFEIRSKSETPGQTGTVPDGITYASLLSMKTKDGLAMLQIAANPTGNKFYGRNAHGGNVSMANIPWWQFLMMKNGMLQEGLTVDSPNTKAAVTKNRTVADGTQYQSTFGVSEDTGKTAYAVIDIKDVTNDGSRWGIGVSCKEQKPIFYEYAGGVFKVKDIFHSGNKPSGSYYGNGSAAERNIPVGGIGSAIAVWSSVGNGVVLYYGGLTFSSSSGAEAHSSADVHFRDGVLTLTTAHDKLNANGQVYYYQVL